MKIVQIDYDGTITMENVGKMLLEKFSTNTRVTHNLLYQFEQSVLAENGDSMEESIVRKLWSLVKGEKFLQTEMLVEAVKVPMRPGFPSFIECCRQHDLVPVVVSYGWQFYMNIPKGVPIVSSNVVFSGNEAYVFPIGRLKLKFAQMFSPYILIGDSVTDIAPSHHAVHIFAVDGSPLSEEPAVIKFSDFFEIADWIERSKIGS